MKTFTKHDFFQSSKFYLNMVNFVEYFSCLHKCVVNIFYHFEVLS